MTETALEIIQPRDLAPKPQFFDLGPKQMIAAASEVATVLKEVIIKQGLSLRVQGKDYVKYEGWLTLGSIMSILPKEDTVIELPDGSYEAKVQLINFKNGMVVGGASSICSIDEQRWSKAEKYARRSMAITRATGKAYRLTLGWIMPLAGFEATPAEEMPQAVVYYTGTVEQKTELVKLFNKYGIEKDRMIDLSNKFMNLRMEDLSRLIELEIQQ